MNHSPIDTDVIIIGAGPAGACAALSLLNHSDLRVTVIEQSDLSGVRVGEHVSASIFELIKYLQIDKKDFEPGSFIASYGNTSYWGSDKPTIRNSIFTTDSATYQLDRDKFDFKLLENVADKGGTVYPRTKCKSFQQLENDHWKLSLKHPEQGEFTLTGKYLIDASGRLAHVCRHIGVSNKKLDNLVGVGAFFNIDDNKKIKQEQLMETSELGWWYSARLPNQQMVATFFSDADIISRHNLNKMEYWQKLLSTTEHIKRPLKGLVSSSTPWVRHASSQISNPVERKNFIAIGDAAASFDPISSMGIGFAMSSACHAANTVIGQLSDIDDQRKSAQINAYQQDIVNHFDHYLNLRKQFYRQETRWSTSDFWARRH